MKTKSNVIANQFTLHSCIGPGTKHNFYGMPIH